MVRKTLIGLALLICAASEANEPWVLPVHNYPIVTEEMFPAIGYINNVLEYPIARSVAVVGADEISAQWLKLNNSYLMEINCVGVVVNVQSEEDLEALRSYTDIPLIPMQGQTLVEAFGNVYPIVVDSDAGMVRQ